MKGLDNLSKLIINYNDKAVLNFYLTYVKKGRKEFLESFLNAAAKKNCPILISELLHECDIEDKLTDDMIYEFIWMTFINGNVRNLDAIYNIFPYYTISLIHRNNYMPPYNVTASTKMIKDFSNKWLPVYQSEDKPQPLSGRKIISYSIEAIPYIIIISCIGYSIYHSMAKRGK